MSYAEILFISLIISLPFLFDLIISIAGAYLLLLLYNNNNNNNKYYMHHLLSILVISSESSPYEIDLKALFNRETESKKLIYPKSPRWRVPDSKLCSHLPRYAHALLPHFDDTGVLKFSWLPNIILMNSHSEWAPACLSPLSWCPCCLCLKSQFKALKFGIECVFS